jgi:hypothetical protein
MRKGASRPPTSTRMPSARRRSTHSDSALALPTKEAVQAGAPRSARGRWADERLNLAFAPECRRLDQAGDPTVAKTLSENLISIQTAVLIRFSQTLRRERRGCCRGLLCLAVSHLRPASGHWRPVELLLGESGCSPTPEYSSLRRYRRKKARSGPLAFLLRGSRPIVDPERGKQIVETQVSQDIGEARLQDGRAIAAARNKEPRSRTWGAPLCFRSVALFA